MGPSTPRPNRGPAAAAENRRALLDAARTLFAERGYAVPMNAVARAAGVGQAVLYRHFPRRLDLAYAVFEENFAELEGLARASGDDVFERFFARMVELVLESFGFVELVVGARGEVADYDGGARLAEVVTAPLRRAQEAGRISSDVTVEEVGLGLRMVYGAAATAADHEQRTLDVRRAHAVVTASWRR